VAVEGRLHSLKEELQQSRDYVMYRELVLRHDRAELRRTLAAIYKTKGDRTDDIRVRIKMEKIEAKMHTCTQRAPDSIPVLQQQQGGDDCTP
jgi:hypothetical protein